MSKHCYTTELKLSLGIENTFVRLRAQKLNFFDRLQENQFTKTLNEELDRMKIKNSFPDEIKELLKLVEDADPYSDSLSHKTKIKLLIEAWTIHEKALINSNKTVQLLKKVYRLNKSENINKQIEFLINKNKRLHYIPLE